MLELQAVACRNVDIMHAAYVRLTGGVNYHEMINDALQPVRYGTVHRAVRMKDEKILRRRGWQQPYRLDVSKKR